VDIFFLDKYNKLVNIIFHNPHAIWFKTNISCYYADTKSISKYDYLFDYIYRKNKKIKVLVDESSMAPLFRGSLRLLDSPIIDFYAWLLINRLSPSKFEIIKKASTLGEDDIIFSFLYGSFTYLNWTKDIESLGFLSDFKNSNAYKVLHLTHYAYNPALGAFNSEFAGVDLFVGENNLFKNSAFFRNFFNWYNKNVMVLPFVAQRRFQPIKSFSLRLNKALSTGTNTHRITEINFNSFFKSDVLQPMRETISINSEKLKPFLDSLITNIQDNSNFKLTGYASQLGKFLHLLTKPLIFVFGDIYRLCNLVYNYIFKRDFSSMKNERGYYKIDIVESYNNYKMFIVPEEIIGLPGIGFVEGMSCGCAYIGIRDPMYMDLGLVDGIHYIGYDGTLDDLIFKITYYQKHEEELERIASNGYNFVSQNFNEEKVASDFFAALYEQAKYKTLKND
jgi:glycosyltransferase involved in cell wall biosynthesis